MTIIAVAATRGTDLLRVAQILALHYAALEDHTAYIEVLRSQEESLYCTPIDLPPNILRRIAVTSENVNRGILEALERLGDARTIIVDLGRSSGALSDDLLKIVDIVLVPTLPAQPSVYDATRLVSDIAFRKAFWAMHDLKAQPWLMGAGCVGGGAIVARLRHAAQRLMVREALFVDAETLPILHWGLPLVHWSVIDDLFGLGIELKLQPPHQMNLFHTLYRQTALLAKHPTQAPTMAEMRADSPGFYEPWRRSDLRDAAERFADLAEDLHVIKAGLGPLPEDLLHTAKLDDWKLTQSNCEALQGTVSNHPSLVDGHHITTSVATCLGLDNTWVRTLSRFYRLSNPAVDPGGQISANGTVKH